MDTLSNKPPPPLSEADFAVECYETARSIGLLPFSEGAQITRSLWLIYEHRWGGRWRRACIPLDASLDLPDSQKIATECDLIARLMERPQPDETALVILRRPGSLKVSEADAYIFRAMCRAVAARRTGPWSFYVTGPHGARKVR